MLLGEERLSQGGGLALQELLGVGRVRDFLDHDVLFLLQVAGQLGLWGGWVGGEGKGGEMGKCRGRA